MASETQLLRAPRHDRKRPSVRKPKYHSHLLEVSIVNAVEEGKEEMRTRRTFASTSLYSLYSAADSKKTKKEKERDSLLSMARMVMLCTAFISRSKGLAVLMTPVAASMLKKRSRSVFRSIEYLEFPNGKSDSRSRLKR